MAVRIRVARWVVVSLALAGGPSLAGACPTIGDEPVRVVAVEQRLELRLADGRLIRLVGLDPAMPTPDAPDLDETARSRLAARVAGKAASLHLLERTPDRWGRWPALVFEDAAVEGGAVAGLAIAAGLGRYLAEPAARACREEWLTAEQTARSAKLGLWADPYYGVLAIDDHAAFAERSGTIVLAQGRLRAVESSVYRTTLRFEAPDSHGSHMLVATIPPRVMKTFKAENMDVGAMIGRRLRFRGLLDLRFGPRVELAGPDTLEITDAPVTAAVPAPAN